MNIILFKTLLLQGELIRASAENGFIMNKGNLIIQDVKRTSAGESLTWFMRIQKSVLHVFQLKYSIGIYYYFLMNTNWKKYWRLRQWAMVRIFYCNRFITILFIPQSQVHFHVNSFANKACKERQHIICFKVSKRSFFASLMNLSLACLKQRI